MLIRMKRMGKTITLTVTIALVLTAIGVVSAAPKTPHRVYGYASQYGTPVDASTEVTAELGDGTTVSTVYTGVYNGDNYYDFTDENAIPGKYDGQTVWFFVAGENTGESVVVSSGGSTQLNLNVEDTTKPAKFQLNTPENNALISDNTPTLEWEASSDAESGLSHYEVWLDDGNPDNVTAGTESYTTPEITVDGDHQWYIVAVDNSGNKRTSENVFYFDLETVKPTVQISVSPTMVSESTVGEDNFTVTLTYSENMDTSVDPSISFSPNVEGENLENESVSWNLAENVATVLYDVADVDAENAEVNITVSGGQDDAGNAQLENTLENAFDIDTKGPTVPTLVTPAAGSVITDNKPTFEWSEVATADNYDLLVDNDSDFSSLEVEVLELTYNGYTVPSADALSDDAYYWKVKARNGYGNTTESDMENFTVDTTAPTVVIDWPSAGENIGSENVNLQFSRSDAVGIDNYEFYVDGLLIETVSDNTVDNYNFTGLVDGENTLKVKAIDYAGNENSDNVTVTTDTAVPYGGSIDYPAAGENISSDNVNVKWSSFSDDTTGVEKYMVKLEGGSYESVDSSVDNYNFTARRQFGSRRRILGLQRAGGKRVDPLDIPSLSLLSYLQISEIWKGSLFSSPQCGCYSNCPTK